MLLNGSVGDLFRTTVGVGQGSQLSPVLFNIFLEKSMQNALTPQHPLENGCIAGDAVEDAEETGITLPSVFIGGRPL